MVHKELDGEKTLNIPRKKLKLHDIVTHDHP